MLYFIGLGLSTEKDISVAGLEIVKKATRVYLEAYTSILMISAERLEAFYGRSVIIADREMVESSADEILFDAKMKDIAFLVVGDPFGATTHTDLLLRARSLSIPTRTLHNASIMNAIGACGLQLYNFGQTVSMVFYLDNWRPASWYDRVAENAALGLHTLILLDIKVKEQSWENLARGRKFYEPPRYMSVKECCSQMIETEEAKKAGVCSADRLAVAVERLGSVDQTIVTGTLKELSEIDVGPPLHSMVLIGRKCHELEMDFVREYVVNRDTFDAAYKSGGYGTRNI